MAKRDFVTLRGPFSEWPRFYVLIERRKPPIKRTTIFRLRRQYGGIFLRHRKNSHHTYTRRRPRRLQRPNKTP